jgi:hypothetical protein
MLVDIGSPCGRTSVLLVGGQWVSMVGLRGLAAPGSRGPLVDTGGPRGR